ncbi:MAG: LOG family protein, partial [Elioraea sp.]|nr:LOG family protein [Elioraea sp.]
MVGPLRIRTANGDPSPQASQPHENGARALAPNGERELEINAMHIRKAWMAAEADAFVMLPGGLGTLDETIEILTWRQLGLHDKPIVLCDVAGSARPLVAAIEAVIEAGFAEPSARSLFALAEGPDEVLPLLAGPRATPGVAAVGG